ncbi:hypothetical protein OVW19_30220, partial [Klebsiella pneumoniae]|uniref:hypothetical protein n=1 Tax=Klebsiella pneumoniae TaxID=573 RepID=UPI00226DCDD4
VEYRRQSQILYERMQSELRHKVLVNLFHAVPLAGDERDTVDTVLTRAARRSTENADKIIDVEEFEETDFTPAATAKTEAERK